jgi:hypothetical protein
MSRTFGVIKGVLLYLIELKQYFCHTVRWVARQIRVFKQTSTERFVFACFIPFPFCKLCDELNSQKH